MNLRVNNKMNLRNFAVGVVFIGIGAGLQGCDTNYWWSRGQPASVETLVNRFDAKFETALSSRSTERADVAPTMKTVASEMKSILVSLDSANKSDGVIGHLVSARAGMMALEGKLSIASRAAHNELNGQLRAIIEQADKKQPLDGNAFRLYTARLLSFFTDELSVPAPVV